MSDRSEIIAWFVISGRFDPDGLRLGVAPTRTKRAGGTAGSSGLVGDGSTWVLESGLPRSATVRAHVAALLAELGPAIAGIATLPRELDREIALVVRIFGGDRPEFHLTADEVRQLSALSASIDIDIYAFEASD